MPLRCIIPRSLYIVVCSACIHGASCSSVGASYRCRGCGRGEFLKRNVGNDGLFGSSVRVLYRLPPRSNFAAVLTRSISFISPKIVSCYPFL
ncbi:hypothetical protein EDD85DRAFT_818516 [Armillaria nabsnona]|nr:hypothetical protein EDD85DRAFT_818516 [Armillaria nabsnona]